MGFGCTRTEKLLSDEILNLYAEGPDGLSDNDCEQLREEYGLTEEQTSCLQKALGKGAEGFITQDEYKELSDAGFASSTLHAIKKNNFCASLYRRSIWLCDNAVTSVFRSDYDPKTRTAMLQELEDMALTLKSHGMAGGVDKEKLVSIILSSNRSILFEAALDDRESVKRAAFDTFLIYAGPQDMEMVADCAIENSSYAYPSIAMIDYFADNMARNPGLATSTLLNIKGDHRGYALERLVAVAPKEKAIKILSALAHQLIESGNKYETNQEKEAGYNAFENIIAKLLARPECAEAIYQSAINKRSDWTGFAEELKNNPTVTESIKRVWRKTIFE